MFMIIILGKTPGTDGHAFAIDESQRNKRGVSESLHEGINCNTRQL